MAYPNLMKENSRLDLADNSVDGSDITTEKRALPEKAQKRGRRDQDPRLVYIILPAIFLSVTLIGGMRLAAGDNAFIFLKPALVCLVFATVTLVLFARSKMIIPDGWISSDLSGLQNAANAAVLVTLFSATVQIFNSLLPEKGMPFWVVGFCFFWTLWTNLFAEFDARRLVRSLTAIFGLAFAAKYLILANLAPVPAGNWLQRMIENPGKETISWLLDLPGYSEGTGYIQFFTLVLYLLGLFLLPQKPSRN